MRKLLLIAMFRLPMSLAISGCESEHERHERWERQRDWDYDRDYDRD
jgi:hypothetical protein